MIAIALDMHHLQDPCIYGPVPSRRYGRTLGINPFPGGKKVCSFNCVYCQLGWTTSGETDRPDLSTAVDPRQITQAMEIAAKDPAIVGIDVISICGNGEPTLHPDFPGLVDAVRGARDRFFPKARILLLSNGSELARPEIFAAAARLDETAVKIDAGGIRTQRRVNLPEREFDLGGLIATIKRLPNATVQSCFVDGAVTNAGDDDVALWLGAVRTADPRRVDIYTLSRRPPTEKIVAVDRHTIEKIARRAQRVLPCEVRVFSDER